MMAVMAESRSAPSPERLLSIIELQNAIIAAGMNSDEVMGLVVERAGTLTGASGSVVALTEADEIVTRAAAGSARLTVGQRAAKASVPSGRAIVERGPVRGDDSLAVPLLYGLHALIASR